MLIIQAREADLQKELSPSEWNEYKGVFFGTFSLHKSTMSRRMSKIFESIPCHSKSLDVSIGDTSLYVGYKDPITNPAGNKDPNNNPSGYKAPKDPTEEQGAVHVEWQAPGLYGSDIKQVTFTMTVVMLNTEGGGKYVKIQTKSFTISGTQGAPKVRLALTFSALFLTLLCLSMFD